MPDVVASALANAIPVLVGGLLGFGSAWFVDKSRWDRTQTAEREQRRLDAERALVDQLLELAWHYYVGATGMAMKKVTADSAELPNEVKEAFAEGADETGKEVSSTVQQAIVLRDQLDSDEVRDKVRSYFLLQTLILQIEADASVLVEGDDSLVVRHRWITDELRAYKRTLW